MNASELVERQRLALQLLQSREALAVIERVLRNPNGAPVLTQPELAADLALMISADLCAHVAPLISAHALLRAGE